MNPCVSQDMVLMPEPNRVILPFQPKKKIPSVLSLSPKQFFDLIEFCAENSDRFQREVLSLFPTTQQRLLLKMEAWVFCQKFPDRQKQILSFIQKVKIAF